MEPRAAWGAGLVLVAVLAAGAWPGAGGAPAAVACGDGALVELRGDAGDDGAFGPPRLVCADRLPAALDALGSRGRPAPTVDAVAIGEDGSVRAVSFSARTAFLLGRPIDVNRADPEDLEALPGIGAGLARRIVAARERDGPFPVLGDLRRVKGLGASRIRAIAGWAVAGTGPPR